ncbi:MAG: periplasmic heavy metal sensor, partial [Thermodesulfobacteriota bacterium]|nr:periplasmic heavy metal sensor [Thermodesulfobacteriota bacterium]
MKRLLMVLLVLGLAVFLTTPALCQGPGKGTPGDAEFSMDCSGHSAARDYMKSDAWEALTPKQREKWSQQWGDYLAETLPLRQQFAAKRLELQTAWAQPKVDDAKIEKLCSEMAELYAERM